MRFEIDDEVLLRVAGVSSTIFAAHALAAPRSFHDTYMAKDQPFSETSWRWFGMAVGCGSAQELVISASSPSKKLVKNSLCAAGIGNLLAAGFTAYNMQEGIQKKETAIANTVGMGVLGAICLWRGLEGRDWD